jgi:hypothetical protein
VSWRERGEGTGRKSSMVEVKEKMKGLGCLTEMVE